MRTNKQLLKIILASTCFGMMIPLASCSRKQRRPADSDTPGITISSGRLPTPNGSESIPYMGGVIATRVIAGKVFIPVEGTFSDASFASVSEAAAAEGMSGSHRTDMLRHELARDIKAIESKMSVLNARIIPDVGFFTAFIPFEGYERLSQVKGLSHRVLINPIVSMPAGDLSALRNPQDIPLGVHSSDGRDDLASFSGLERIGVAHFLRTTKAEIGEDVDGANVRVGVADTGVTLNHPSFFDAAGQSRVDYMKDFTNEGSIYFPETAAFSAREPKAEEIPAGAAADEIVVITAKFITPPVGTKIPPADVLSDVTEQVFMVSPAIKATLLTSGSGARLGVFSEAAFATDDKSEVVDLNHNGKSDDMLWALLLPEADISKSKMLIDISGRGDFRRSEALSDFNSSRSTIKVFSETPGFEISSTDMINSDGTKTKAVVASIVGFDPGNHGSHVSGIIAGRKTIANDRDNTLARGVAPNTRLMVNRVCANNGGCQATAAIIDLALNGAEVINMSLGGLSPMNDGYGVQETVINRLTVAKNTVFVISAGNSGPGHQTVGSPSTARLSLSVAATGSRKLIERQHQWPGSGKPRVEAKGDHDFLMFFSSRGPTAAGGMKPDISAPGTQLSAIQLNAAEGARPGLDTYWGTSMAAPTAAGAVALLIDAAKRYNKAHPEAMLPLDAITIRGVIAQSSVPFDATTFNTATGKKTLGQYTWIDEGNGMINLPRAWALLKATKDARLPSAVSYNQGGRRVDVTLDYQVRVLRKSPNGQDYTGAETGPTDSNGGKEPRFGRGIYLDATATESLIGVQIARRLPVNAVSRDDVGELTRQLNTTADLFELETVIHGSDVEWLKAGTLAQLDCVGAPARRLTIVGPGAVDQPAGSPSASNGFDASNLQVCVDRARVANLPAGDHGALIKAYRVIDRKRETIPSFIVPVYLAVPHATMAGQAAYEIGRDISSFEVQRHYVRIPEGTSAVNVTIEVPEAKVSGSSVSGCSGVVLMMLEGENTAIPGELTPRSKGQVINCDKTGAVSTKRVFTYSRLNPKPGIWDALIYGQYQYKDSRYKLKVEFARVEASVAEITGTRASLSGQMGLQVREGSGAITPDAQKSTMLLSGLTQEITSPIEQDQDLRVPGADGKVARRYGESVTKVTFKTGGLKGSDIDLVVLACETESMDKCETAGSSGGSTDEEMVEFTPDPARFYVPVVTGYTVAVRPALFKSTEILTLKEPEAGALTVTGGTGGVFDIGYNFDVAASKILMMPEFTSGLWRATGDVTLRGADGFSFLRIPVTVSAQ